MKRDNKIILIIIIVIVVVSFYVLYFYSEMFPHCEKGYFSNDDKAFCYYKMAVSNNDSEYCSLIPDDYTLFDIDKDRCYLDLAIINDDITLCSKGSTDYQIALCKVVITNSTEYCDEIQDEKDKDTCYLASTLILGD